MFSLTEQGVITANLDDDLIDAINEW